jgi:hypothetical protein
MTAPVVAVAAAYADGTATIPNIPARTEVAPATAQPPTRPQARGRRAVLVGGLVGAMLTGAAVAGAVAYYNSDGGSAPANSVNTPATTVPTTLPPTTLPPATSPEIVPGNGNGNGEGSGRDLSEQWRQWADDLKKRIREGQNGD